MSPRYASSRRRLGKDRGRFTKILATLHQATELLEQALSPEQAGWIALVALTAGEGFGFNRAFLLRRSNSSLTGWLGIGPRTGEEASRLWEELKAQNIKPLAQLHTFQPEVVAREVSKLELVLKALATPVHETCGQWPKAFLARRDTSKPCVRHWLEVLNSPILLVIPLVRANNFWGVVLADNFVTKAPISGPLMEGAQTLCHALQVSLERTELWKRFLEEQESRQKAEHAVVLLEAARFLAHDIKNPLTAAFGLLRQLLLQRPANVEEWIAGAEKIFQGLSRLENCVNRLVQELAHRGEGINIAPIDVVSLVAGVVASWKPFAESRQVELVLEEPAETLRVWADHSYLERCVENLLSNAVKAVGLGGIVRVSMQDQGLWVRISVADNGQPLPPSLKKSFTAGEQTGAPGEGFRSLWRLTEAMGGKLGYDEDEPGWVRFSLLLRRCQ